MSRAARLLSTLGLRTWLLLLVLCSTMPLTGALFWSALETRRVTMEDALGALGEKLARAQAMMMADIARTVELLTVISRDPDVDPNDARSCSSKLEAVRGKIDSLSGLTIIHPDGTVACSLQPVTGPVSLADRDYVQAALKSIGPTIGQPTVSRVSGRTVLPLAIAARLGEESPSPAGVLAARLDFDDLLARLAQRFGIADVQLTVLSDEGTVIARSPDPEGLAGLTFADNDLVTRLKTAATKSGTMQAVGIDGVQRVDTYVAIDLPSGRLWLVADLPSDRLFNAIEAVFIRTLIAAGIVTLIAMTLGLVVCELAVRRPILRIEAATRALERRQARVRVGDIGGVRELVQLAHHVDRLASALDPESS